MLFLFSAREDTAAITKGLAFTEEQEWELPSGAAISRGFCSLGKPSGSVAAFKVHTRCAWCYYGGAAMIIITGHKVRKFPQSFAILDNTNTRQPMGGSFVRRRSLFFGHSGTCFTGMVKFSSIEIDRN